VVNIDNGFGAGYQASLINKIAVGHGVETPTACVGEKTEGGLRKIG
jgi:hypothetical protein